jgi:mycofactocin system glycosyltransferase
VEPTGTRSYRLDSSVRRFGSTVIGGSPLTLFRLTDAGARLLDRVAAGEAVPDSALTRRLVETGAIHPDPAPATAFGPDDVTVVVPALGAPRSVPTGAIVVDDGTQPPIPGATVRHDRSTGPAAARNSGLDRVTTPLVAFVDADVDLPPGWLEPLLAHFDDDAVALVAPRVRSRDVDTVLGRYERAHSPLDLGGLPARIRAGTRVSYVPAAAIVCRTDAVRAVGGFDPELRFGEDVDLCWRLDGAGWRCRYVPTVEVEHDPRRGWWELVRQRIGYGSSAAPLARRHPGALSPLRMNGWSLGAWLLAAAGRPVAGAAIGIGSAAALVAKLPDVPPRAAFDLALSGNLRAGDQLATAVRRAWWPLLVLAAPWSRVARRVLLATMIAARRPERLIDDVAYSVGVWRGVLRERNLDPLRPTLVSWPGKTTG